MPTYKLSYFGITALGEPIRQALALGGIAFEDDRHTGETWGKLKTDPKYADLQPVQMPIFEITHDDGTVQYLTQSRAILRYVGTIAKYDGKPLYPEDAMTRYFCDEVIEMVEDVRPLMMPTFAILDAAEKEAARAALVAPDGKMVPHFKKINARLGKFAFAAGAAPSIADCYLVPVLHLFQAPSFLDGFPADTYKEYKNITAVKDRLCALPPLKELYKDAEAYRAPFRIA